VNPGTTKTITIVTTTCPGKLMESPICQLIILTDLTQSPRRLSLREPPPSPSRLP
jgi:hypothetical protein